MVVAGQRDGGAAEVSVAIGGIGAGRHVGQHQDVVGAGGVEVPGLGDARVVVGGLGAPQLVVLFAHGGGAPVDPGWRDDLGRDELQVQRTRGLPGEERRHMRLQHGDLFGEVVVAVSIRRGADIHRDGGGV